MYIHVLHRAELNLHQGIIKLPSDEAGAFPSWLQFRRHTLFPELIGVPHQITLLEYTAVPRTIVVSGLALGCVFEVVSRQIIRVGESFLKFLDVLYLRSRLIFWRTDHDVYWHAQLSAEH